ncbi:hypothetical protein BV22DRAFT_1040987 [Leucogyrophana mollusca]|uniref:Uncharacterized protein n=1 Tax=Leucogyrophana mollusca TaxID=85980 RepID=A0ACB8B0Z5_9AGAM|nr:hypothetical protein BV22DRAFT_1040987 [Leucogyrophana mollusca]
MVSFSVVSWCLIAFRYAIKFLHLTVNSNLCNSYRKLTGSVKWLISTDLLTAPGVSSSTLRVHLSLDSSLQGPLGGSFALRSLRTNKADVAVGVPQEITDKLDVRCENGE